VTEAVIGIRCRRKAALARRIRLVRPGSPPFASCASPVAASIEMHTFLMPACANASMRFGVSRAPLVTNVGIMPISAA
jgi:hypothetical protein